MIRMIVGFDPSKAQPAIGELRDGLGPGVEWRVLNLDQNPNGVEPLRPQASAEEHDHAGNLLQRLASWLGGDKDDAPEHAQQPAGSMAPGGSGLELSEEELAYLRAAPARAGTVILVTAPEGEATAVRLWAMRHGGFSLSPAIAPDTATEIKES
jgi:hypothetical protein